MNTATESPTPDENGGKRRTRLILMVVVAGIVLAIGRLWWRSHFYETTDNAYLEGNITLVAPRVEGVVTRVLVADNQTVQAGDPLLELDAADYEVRVERIDAQMRELAAQLQQFDAEIERSRAEALSATAALHRATAEAGRTTSDAARQVALFGKEAKAVSRTELEAAVAARDGASADVAARQAEVKVADAKVAASISARVAAQARNDTLAAGLKQARLQLGYTMVKAPVSGRIGHKSAEVGAHVQPGEKLLAIVQDGLWLVANFKEVQLRDLHPGQKASVRIDAYDDHPIEGTIDSISPASGAEFALLPSDNATGNFTKIVQRVPVKITFDAATLGPLAGRLVPGMSALVEVDLRQGDPHAADGQ